MSQVERLSFRRSQEHGAAAPSGSQTASADSTGLANRRARHRGIVESHVGLFRTSNPVDAGGRRSKRSGGRDRDGLGDNAEQRALRGIEHAARIELDNDAEHIVVLQKVGNLLDLGDDPCEVERVGAQPGEHADSAVRGRRPLLVIDDEATARDPRQRADAALDHVPGSIVVQDIEPEAEADLFICRLKLRCVANAGNAYVANNNRMKSMTLEKTAFFRPPTGKRTRQGPCAPRPRNS